MSNEAEREAFEAWMKDQWTQARDIPLGVEAMQIMGACSEVYWQGWKARADWQRAQQSAQAGYVALGEQAIIDQQAARIALYERALLVSWPEGAKGEVCDLWNEARTMGSKGDGN